MMERFFIKDIKINKVRHLKNIKIHVAEEKCKHIIFTGKNGSGKTSVLNAVSEFINSITVGEVPDLVDTSGIWLDFNISFSDIREQFKSGKIIVAYYKADRIFSSVEPKHVEKVQLKPDYAINDTPRNEFIRYLLDLKMTQALAISNGKIDKANIISVWFDKFESLLKQIFDDESVKLVFDEDTFKFSITMDGHEPFGFNTLSSGYAAVLDIVVDLIIRMENQLNKSFHFNIPGIVLIDEIETHLHLELQKNIMKMLTTIFPNIQFIVSSHSPFILNSLDNVIIYDLEKNILVENGLSDVPYSGIVEGYFQADELSNKLREKFNAYKTLANKSELDVQDYEQIADLEMYLNEIPDYLALKLTTEYQELKARMRSREE